MIAPDGTPVETISEQEFDAILGSGTLPSGTPESVPSEISLPEAASDMPPEAIRQTTPNASPEPSSVDVPTADAHAAASTPGHNEITEDEFEDLLDALHGPGQFGESPILAEQKIDTSQSSQTGSPTRDAVGDGDTITEDEFDALLDELHGAGQFRSEVAVTLGAPDTADYAATDPDAPNADALSASVPSAHMPSSDTGVSDGAVAGGASDEITEDEFDALLDALHGEGRFSVAGAETQRSGTEASGTEEPSTSESDAHTPPVITPAASEPQAAPASNSAPAIASKPAPAPMTAPASGASHAATPSPKPAGEPARGVVGGGAGGSGGDSGEGRARPTPSAETTVRVDTETLDRMMNMVGELVLIRNRLSNLQDELGNEEVTRTVSNLDLVTSNLQSVAMQTRMQPIKKVFGRFPRVVRDLARNLGKKVRLEMLGEDTDLDKNLVEALSDPLVHLVRNSVDHGIETPDVREAADKPAEGLLKLSAAQEGDHILLTIEDDGKGIDAESLRKKAVSSGLMDQESAQRLTDQECFELIFMPGLSTKEQISDVSGRGVGMDVVKTRINQLNGAIEIDSALGVGTTIRITLPLTLAIVPTLMVKLAEQPFALPLVNVQEIIDFNPKDVHRVDGQRAIRVRGRVVPLHYLTEWLVPNAPAREGASGHVVIVRIGSQCAALLVDALIGQEEVVIKPLGRFLQHTTQGLAGATITGDGHIALILDLPELLAVYVTRGAA